ncbi:MAG TPA: hypothetical protein VK674_05690 [Candidatus Limnocylindria bacterium]|nr:hypothetical protein [Candidatus Limnocylindria bacterium]
MKKTAAVQAKKLGSRKLLLVIVMGVIVVICGAGFGYSRVQNRSRDLQASDVNQDGTIDILDEAAEIETAQETQDQPEDAPVQPAPGVEAQIYDLKLIGFYLHDHALIGGTYIPDGAPSTSTDFEIFSKGIDLGTCSVVQDITHDYPDNKKQKITLQSVAAQKVVLYDGENTVTVTCPQPGGDIVKSMKVRMMDLKPELCRDFSFSESAVTATTVDELKSGVAGTWSGCVTTPWRPKYHVAIVFNSDGTYSTASNEVLDGYRTPVLYYGLDGTDPNKKYSLAALPDGTFGGDITITFGGTSVQNQLKNVKLMSDKLSFEFLHRNRYGPVKFELSR